MANGINYPWGAADRLIIAADNMILVVNNTKVIASLELSVNARLDIEVDTEIRIGSEIIILLNVANANVELSFGKNIVADTVRGESNRTVALSFVYDGEQYISTAMRSAGDAPVEVENVANITIDAAQNMTTEIDKQLTFAELVLSEPNSTLNINPSEDLPVGSELFLTLEGAGLGNTLNFGNNVLAAPVVAAVNETKLIPLIFDGVRFVATSVAVLLS